MYRSSKKRSKMLPLTALGRMLVVRRFACRTTWWVSCSCSAGGQWSNPGRKCFGQPRNVYETMETNRCRLQFRLPRRLHRRQFTWPSGARVLLQSFG